MLGSILILRINTHHQADEELAGIVLEIGDKAGAIPEHLEKEMSQMKPVTLIETHTKAITKNTIDWERANQKVELNAERFDTRRGSSKLLLYSLKQSSSLVKLATVLMAPAASHASCALSACVRLLI